VAIVASGNYLAGTIWPPILQHAFAAIGWRQTHLVIGLFCLATMPPLALLLGRRPAFERVPVPGAASAADQRPPVSLNMAIAFWLLLTRRPSGPIRTAALG
jgi:hypothetical protein